MLQDSNSSRKTDSFKENSLELALEKIVFLSSNGASVNCWLTQLALKDALKQYMAPVDKMLTHLCYHPRNIAN